MTSYDVPDELEVLTDGPVRVVRLNRPDQLNATNHELHRGLAGLFPQIDADDEARAVVLTGTARHSRPAATSPTSTSCPATTDRRDARRWPTAARS